MEAVLEGKRIRSALDVHLQLEKLLDLPSYYGRNVHALWDVMTGNVERPLLLIWKDSALSRQALGEEFDQIVTVFERVQQQDARHPDPEDRFTLRLE